MCVRRKEKEIREFLKNTSENEREFQHKTKKPSSFECLKLLKLLQIFLFFLMIRRPPRSTLSSSSAASDVYKRQVRIRVHVSRSTERSTETCLTVRRLLSVFFGRPRAGNGSYFCTSVDRPVDRDSRLNSNG